MKTVLKYILFSFLTLLLASTTYATDRYWANVGTDFNDGASWDGGTAPGAGDAAFFTNDVVTQPNLTASKTLGAVHFTPALGTHGSAATSASGGYILTGDPGAILTLTRVGDNYTGVFVLEQCTTGTNKIMVPIAFPDDGSDARRCFNSAAGTLELACPISGNSGNMIVLKSATNSTVILSGDFSGFSGGLLSWGGNPIFVRNSLSIATLTVLGFGVHGSQGTPRFINETGGPLIFEGNPELRLSGGDGITIESDYPVDFGDGGVVFDDINIDRSCPLRINAPLVRIGGSASEVNKPNGYVVRGTGTLEVCGASDYTGKTRVFDAIFLARHPEAYSPLSAIVLASSSSSTPGAVLGLGYGDFTKEVGEGAGCFHFSIEGWPYAGYPYGGWAAYGADRNVNIGGDMRLMTNVTPFCTRMTLGAHSADATVTFQNPLAIENDIVFYAIKGSADIAGRITGVLTGSKNAEKRGNGVLELTANSPLSGTFNIYDGRLLLSGSLDTAMNVKAGGCLAGGGTLSKALTVDAGGMLAMDNRLGSLTVNNNVTFNAGALMEVTLDGTDMAGVVCLGSGGVLKNLGTVSIVIQTAHKNVGRGTMPILDWSGADSPNVAGLNPSLFEVVNIDDFSATFAIEGQKLVMHYRNLKASGTVFMFR